MIDRDRSMYYKRGVKYVTTRDYKIKLEVVPFAPIDNDWVKMDMDGTTVIYRKFYWDGASGPTFDSSVSMIGSLVHDLGYKLIRLNLIDPKYKAYFDKVLHDIMTEDGMWSWRADYWRWAVLNFGAGSCQPSAEQQEQVAP